MECHIWGIQSFIIFPNQNQQFNALLNQRRKDQSSHQLSGREAKLITDEPFDPPRNTTDESPLGNPSPLPVSKDSWLRFVILSAWNEPATHTKKKKKIHLSKNFRVMKCAKWMSSELKCSSKLRMQHRAGVSRGDDSILLSQSILNMMWKDIYSSGCENKLWASPVYFSEATVTKEFFWCHLQLKNIII